MPSDYGRSRANETDQPEMESVGEREVSEVDDCLEVGHVC